MRSGILASLIVAALCACVTAAEQPPQLSPGDIIIVSSGEPADPVSLAAEPWDPAQHISWHWESVAVTMTSRIYNPVLELEPAEGPQWSVSIVSALSILDGTGFLGWSWFPKSIVALDATGRTIASNDGVFSLSRTYHRPSTLPGGPLSMNRTTLTLPFAADAILPDVISRVEWTTDLLVGEETKTADIPFQQNDAWQPLTPGIEAQVEQATVVDGKFEYILKLRYDTSKVANLLNATVNLWQGETLPASAIIAVDVLGPDGKSIQGEATGNVAFGGTLSSHEEGGMGTAIAKWHVKCDKCGTATNFRFTFVSGLAEKQGRFVLTNIPVPQF